MHARTEGSARVAGCEREIAGAYTHATEYRDEHDDDARHLVVVWRIELIGSLHESRRQQAVHILWARVWVIHTYIHTYMPYIQP